MKKQGSSLSPEEISTVEAFLSRLEPGFLPMPIFSQVVRLVVTPTVEVVPFRRTPEGKIQVLMIKRDDDDPNWPGQYHVPGTVIRATDTKTSFQDAFDRVINGEIKGIKVLKGPIFVDYLFHQLKRGSELPMIHWIEVEGEVKGGIYFDVDQLPENIVAHHPIIIRKALEHLEFEKLRNLSWNDVVSAWREREKGIWDEHIRQNAYQDWNDFRFGERGTLAKYKISDFEPEKLHWKALKVLQPDRMVPKILCGPFKGWAIHSNGIRQSISFGEIVKYGEILKNTKVAAILKKLQTEEPRPAIALMGPDGEIVAIDGCHTLSAYAIAASQNITTKAPLILHVAEVPEKYRNEFKAFIQGDCSSSQS